MGKNERLYQGQNIPDAFDLCWKQNRCPVLTTAAEHVVTQNTALLHYSSSRALLVECEANGVKRAFAEQQLQLKRCVSPQAVQPALYAAAKVHCYC